MGKAERRKAEGRQKRGRKGVVERLEGVGEGGQRRGVRKRMGRRESARFKHGLCPGMVGRGNMQSMGRAKGRS